MPRKQNKGNFLQTGVSIIKFKIDIKVTEEDLLKDLVNKTEGKIIKAQTNKFSQN